MSKEETMLRALRIVFVCLPVSAVACGGAPEATNDAAPKARGGNPVDGLVSGQLARGAALQTEIRSAGFECPSVTRSFRQGSQGPDDTWNAECSNGQSFGIVSTPSETTVLSCRELEAKTHTPCFQPF